MTIDVSITGSPDDEDQAAAKLVVSNYNEAQKQLDPPGEELPLTPLGKLGQSYQTVLADIITNAHRSYAAQAAEQKLVNQLRSKWKNATEAQRDAAIAALG